MTTPSARAFTLVEVLVVIAIIAIVAALLFPVFSIVRGKVLQAQDASNFHQIFLAYSMYAGDNDDQLPKAVDSSNKCLASINSTDLDAEEIKVFDAEPLLTAVLFPYTKTNSIFRPKFGPLSKIATCSLETGPEYWSDVDAQFFYSSFSSYNKQPTITLASLPRLGKSVLQERVPCLKADGHILSERNLDCSDEFTTMLGI